MKLTHVQGGTMRRWLLPVFAVLSLMLAPALQAASNVQGSINGDVVTVDGNTVSNAEVTVLSLGTGLTRTEAAGADGRFNFTSLPVGEYRVTAVAPGYPDAVREPVRVNVGTGSSVRLTVGADAAQLERVLVSGAQISPIDIRSTESATILGEATVDRVPVARNITDVALLAPGTTRGDAAFGNLPSFGGATVGENAYYVNGLNVTNFRNGLGGSTIPFEFYQEFQLKTGGYSAEFGRSTGGVINAVTKSGTNEFKFGANVYLEPWIDDFNSARPDVYQNDGTLFIDNQQDEATSREVNLWASGPIIEDKLFFFVLYNPRDVADENYIGTSDLFVDTSTDNAFYGAKIDWNITNNHLFELTAFSDEREVLQDQYAYEYGPWGSGTVGEYLGTGISDRGGMNWAAKYTGFITPDFTLSALVGENNYDRTDRSDLDANPVIIDDRGGSRALLGNWASQLVTTAEDTREVYRIDAEWFIGDHQLRFGIDSETNSATEASMYSGGIAYIYEDTTPGEALPNGGIVPAGVDEAVRLRVYENIGNFETESSAIYIEDMWEVNDSLFLSLGLRSESFNNLNANGESFVEMNNQIAPRLGLAWDPFSDGISKIYANYGRYYLPVATNTNIRLAGGENFYEEYYEIAGENADDTPQLGDQIGPRSVFATGEIADPTQIVNQNLDPMYQDELILGYQRDLQNGWNVGVRAVFRDLKSTLEDVAIDAALNEYAAANGYDTFAAGGFDYYVLTNPGADMLLNVDMDGDGTLESVSLSGDQLGYPESTRYYNAIEMLFERTWDGVWFMKGSYTWSQSYGNNEGFVRSDNGQDDAGLTTLFDQPGLLDGAYGYLPNDRRHSVKLFGAYQFAPNWRVGANLAMESGRPVNAFGLHPTDAFARAYGHESFYQGGQLVPRGTRGRTDFRTTLDLSIDYNVVMGGSDVNFGLDVFNVFDSATPTEVVETAEQNSGAPDPSYLLPTSFQQPRYLRLRAQVTF